MSDTPKNVDDFYSSLFNSLSGEDKIMMAVESFESAKQMVLASLKPGLSESEKRMELLMRFYGDELNEKQVEGFRESINRL
jgi:hypothetical protein